MINRIPLSLYPDYDRRLRNRTGSADLAVGMMGGIDPMASARGLGTLHAITAGGEFHPALRTFVAFRRDTLGIDHCKNIS